MAQFTTPAKVNLGPGPRSNCIPPHLHPHLQSRRRWRVSGMSEQLLNDARLISRYAGVYGLLPADSTLPPAITQAATRLETAPLTPAQEQELNSAVNATARVIAPVTI